MSRKYNAPVTTDIPCACKGGWQRIITAVSKQCAKLCLGSV